MDETPLVMRDHVRKSPAETPMTKMQASHESFAETDFDTP